MFPIPLTCWILYFTTEITYCPSLLSFSSGTILPSSILVPTNDQFSQFNKQGECVGLYYIESVTNELTEITITVYWILKGIHHTKAIPFQFAPINKENVTRVCRVEYIDEKIMPLLFYWLLILSITYFGTEFHSLFFSFLILKPKKFITPSFLPFHSWTEF